MSHRRRPRGPPTHPNSHRWDTTLTSDLENVAKQLEGSDYYNTGLRKQTLMDRKLANTKTSISFGNYKVCLTFYESLTFPCSMHLLGGSHLVVIVIEY